MQDTPLGLRYLAGTSLFPLVVARLAPTDPAVATPHPQADRASDLPDQGFSHRFGVSQCALECRIPALTADDLPTQQSSEKS